MNADLLTKVLNNKDNEKVLKFLNVETSEPEFHLWSAPYNEQRRIYDEGGVIFFRKYGSLIPGYLKYTLNGENVMLNTDTGKIFAFHTGRFSIFHRCDYERTGRKNTDTDRKVITLDDMIDIRELGENWSHLFGDEAKQLLWSYELTQREQEPDVS